MNADAIVELVYRNYVGVSLFTRRLDLEASRVALAGGGFEFYRYNPWLQSWLTLSRDEPASGVAPARLRQVGMALMEGGSGV
jgi:hypothetical protein